MNSEFRVELFVCCFLKCGGARSEEGGAEGGGRCIKGEVLVGIFVFFFKADFRVGLVLG